MSKVRFYLTAVFVFLFTFGGYAQQIKGSILDKNTNQVVPFASVVISNTQLGTMADMDGTFTISVSNIPLALHVSCVGYKDTLVEINSLKPVTIFLQPTVTQLKEAVIVAGENPAHRIIKKVILNRDLNNPEKQCQFTYTTYSKMAFGPDVSANDVAYYEKNDTDSSLANFSNAMVNHYLFFTETVSERKFLPPNHTEETVVANRISGLKSPEFSLMASAFQPFTVYKDYVNILGVSYLSPVARNSYKNYLFEIQDTLYPANDSIFVISFQPRSKTTFKGLTGVLHINTNQYAIQNLQASQADSNSSMQIHLEQMFQFVDGKQWFPVQFNTLLIMNLNADISNPNSPLNKINARGKTYVKNINLNPQLSKSDFGNVILKTEANAAQKDSLFWEAQRDAPLSLKEEKTYQVIDSIGEAENLDTKAKAFEAMATGEFPIGVVNLPLKRLVDFNQYEGVRLGVGLRTNNKVSQHFSVGGYVAYGFNDKDWKMGTDFKIRLSEKNDIYIGASYLRDVTTSGEAQFYKPLAFELRTYSNLYVVQKDKIEGLHAFLNFRLFKDLQNQLLFNSYSQSYTYNYQYVDSQELELQTGQAFQRAEVGYTFRFGFREKYIRSFGQNISLGTQYPYVWARMAHGNTAFGGTFTYTKLDLKITKSYLIKGFGKFGFSLEGGFTSGNVPASLLRYGRGMRYEDWAIYIENAFNTMMPNEFLSNQYATVHLHHQFNPFVKTTYFAPQLSIVQSLGWGQLANSEAHKGKPYQTMEKGFFESGILLDKLLVMNTSGLGVGAFYRYGPYAFSNAAQNWAYKFTFIYVF